jgi:predicted ribosome quality control (RQC) complex YloA/Tae2 family protein
MIQYYLDLQKQVKTIQSFQLAHAQIQKIYSTAYFISFSIRSPGKTWHLYLGRGGGQEGLWIGNHPPTSELRRKDAFLEYLRRHVSSCSFLEIELDPYDRIIKFVYQKFGQKQSLLFFWRGRKLYFIHHFQDGPDEPFRILLSWHGKAILANTDLDNHFELFNEVGRRSDIKHDLQSPHASTIEDLLKDELSAAKLKGLSSSPTFLQRKISNIESDLEKTRQWGQLQKILDKGSSLEGYELKVGDHKIKFEGELNPFERRNLLFEKIKKLKKGESILTERLSSAQDQLAGQVQTIKSSSQLPMVKPVWGREEIKQNQQLKMTEKEDYKVFKFDDFSVGVGLSAQGNDQLRNKWAKKEDFWFHLDGVKSSHVIVKIQQGHHLESEMINMASTILAYFSHFSGDWIPIIYTAVKNLKGVSGSAGMVIYKKEKHLRCPRIDSSSWLKEDS